MRMRLAAGVVLVLCRSVFGQGADVDIPYQKFVLKNGLTLIVHEDHKAPNRGVQRLVSRGLEEREIREDRFRTPVRAPDVRWQPAPHASLYRSDGAAGRHRP